MARGKPSPTIHDLIRDWTENRGWPVHSEIRIGPARCGIGRCRKSHAYARSIVHNEKDREMSTWVYERPCDINAPMGYDRAKP